jgi:hypothetical protein
MRIQRSVQARRLLFLLFTVVVAFIPTAATPQLWGQIQFSDARIIVEVNSTDGDAGIQAFLDGEPWESVTIVNPHGRKIAEVVGKGHLGTLGLTELFFESEEPSFEDLPLQKFLQLFPVGEYRFLGKTVEGDEIVGTATLTHNIPHGPVILSPHEGGVVNRNHTSIAWRSVRRPGIEIVRYQVIVEREEPTLLVFSVDLPATARRVSVPREFLESGTEYKCEVLATEAGGNQTITESFFETQ